MTVLQNSFSENKGLYTNVMERTFDISKGQILLKASRVNDPISVANNELDLSQFCDNQIL